MDDSLYDEFGNYLGPDLEEDEDLELEEEEEEEIMDEVYEDDEEPEEQQDESMQVDGKLTKLQNTSFY